MRTALVSHHESQFLPAFDDPARLIHKFYDHVVACFGGTRTQRSKGKRQNPGSPADFGPDLVIATQSVLLVLNVSTRAT
jgi:hypothetical protein